MQTTTHSGTWAIDPAHTSVEFAVKHMMISTVKGRFGEVEGTLTFPEDGQPSLDVTVKTASIDTRNEQRDQHLRSGDFFDAEKFPVMRYVSRRVERTADGYTVEGDLTIRDVTKPVTLSVVSEGAGKDPWGNEKLGFSATGRINRADFGLTWNAALETGGVLVSEEVKLTIDAQLVRAAAAQAA